MVCVKCIGRLIITRFILAMVSLYICMCFCFAKSHQSPEIVPDFGDIRVQANCSGIRIEGIPVLVDLIVKHTNGAPEGGITAIPINRLLVSFVRFRVFLLRHVASSEEVPTLSIRVV